MNGCFAAVHGVNSVGLQVLPSYDNPDVATMHGGSRQDFKMWNFKNDTWASTGTLNFDPVSSGFLFRSDFAVLEAVEHLLYLRLKENIIFFIQIRCDMASRLVISSGAGLKQSVATFCCPSRGWARDDDARLVHDRRGPSSVSRES